MPIIKVISHRRPPSTRKYQGWAELLGPLFDTPSASIRFVWQKAAPGEVFNWGAQMGEANPGPIVSLVYRDRLSSAQLEKVYVQLLELMSDYTDCDLADVFIYVQRLQAGDVCVGGRVWLGKKKYKFLKTSHE